VPVSTLHYIWSYIYIQQSVLFDRLFVFLVISRSFSGSSLNGVIGDAFVCLLSNVWL
jgi:hypothetical protein